MNKDAPVQTIVAYHEAGHAVVAWALGIPLVSVHAGDRNGQLLHASNFLDQIDLAYLSAAEEIKIEKDALVLLAGERAEVAYYESNEQDTDIYLSADDRHKLGYLRDRFQSACLDVNITDSALERKVDKLIEKHWDQITALATVLTTRSLLSGSEATKIIENSWKKQQSRFNWGLTPMLFT